MAWVAPPVLTVGEVLTASIMNTITGDLSFLYGDASWTTLPLGSGWTVVGTDTPLCRLVGTRVVLRGQASGTGGSGSTIATLPVGYRPLTTTILSVVANGAAAGVQVQTGGAIVVQFGSATSYVALDSVDFDTI